MKSLQILLVLLCVFACAHKNNKSDHFENTLKPVRKLIIPVSAGKTKYPLISAASTLQYKVGSVEKTTSLQNNVSVIYHSMDAGKTWTPFDDGIPPEATVSSFLVKGNSIFASTDYNGLYLIKDGEKLWARIDEDLPDKADINAIAVISNILIIGTRNHGIMLSKNNGKNWRYPVGQIKNSPIRCLLVKEKIMYAGADNGIHKSLDYGNTWVHVWKGVQVNGFTEANNKIYAALMNGAVMTNDHGVNWKYVYRPYTLHDISTDGERIYALTLGDGLRSSKDDGMTWTDVNRGLGTLNLYTFELKRFDNKIFAAQWYGIYVSDDWGGSWRLIENGLPDSTAFSTLETTKTGLIAGIGLRKN